jgi:methionyl-tRNA synthetase
LKMIQLYCEGVIPGEEDENQRTPEELELDHVFHSGPGNALTHVKEMYNDFDFDGALERIWLIVSGTDQYLTETRPWVMAKDEARRARLNGVLHRSAHALGIAVGLAYPVIPDGAQAIWNQLGKEQSLGSLSIDLFAYFGFLKPGTPIGDPEGVFPRVDKKEASERIETMENEIRNPGSTQPDASTTTTKKPAEGASTGTSAAGTAAIPAGAPGAGTASATAPIAAAVALAPGAKIGIEDFAKVELRVGVVKSAEKIAGADKLLKVMVDIGDEVRQVLAGIAPAYAPEELVGRKVVVVTNLAPRKMRGVESNGMLLAASAGPDGKPVLCTFAEDIPAGAKVK